MRIVSRNAANASAKHFIPPPANSFVYINPDFAECSSGEGAGTYLRALNMKAHRWLLEHGTRGKWVQGRLLLPKYRPCQITLDAMNSRFSVARSGLALPEPRPKLKLVRSA